MHFKARGRLDYAQRNDPAPGLSNAHQCDATDGQSKHNFMQLISLCNSPNKHHPAQSG